MMKAHELQDNRAVFMAKLYEASGRTNGVFTGLWQEFCFGCGARLVETDGKDIFEACVVAIDETKSVMPTKHAAACMEVFRTFIMGEL